MANKPSPLLLFGVAAILLMGKKKKKKRSPATVDDELSRPETDPESAPAPAPESEWESEPESEWEPAPAPEWELPPEWEPDEPAPAPEEEGFKCERMLYNGYCIDTHHHPADYGHHAPWWLDIWDADGARLYFRYGVQGFQSEADALHHAYSKIDEWTT